MDNNLQPTFANGKICYIEIPALDIQQSSKFYQTVFGWNIRDDNQGNISFDDTVGQVSGMWVTLVPANFILHRTGKVDMNNLTTFQYWVQFLAVPSLAFGLFLFLSCVFVPIQKKYAGLLVFVL